MPFFFSKMLMILQTQESAQVAENHYTYYISGLALLVSAIALLLNYRTSTRQKHAQNPFFSLSRGTVGRNTFHIKITNSGSTAARDIILETKKGGLIRWSNQFNPAERHQNHYGEMVGGEAPWTNNCVGETRNIEPAESKTVIISKEIDENEVLIIKCKNYMKKNVKNKKKISEIYYN